MPSQATEMLVQHEAPLSQHLGAAAALERDVEANRVEKRIPSARNR
jgi:hypothetical protein